ncbi:MAG TPA: nitroreductase family deazaflavin-dependent oxidoreductase [Anaerolineales bacterium]|nr:nitroreductase family deazaflavin-dependent oxidoreductase [Anaerolineales bacterium]
MDPALEERLRQGFKYLNRFMVLMWRLGFGAWMNAWPQGLGRYLVITHRGRKTGTIHRTPVNFARVDGEIYCTAGFGKVSDWYRNTKANPSVEVWLPDGWWEGTVEDVSDAENRLPLLRAVLIGSGFAAFAAGVNPYQLTDGEMDALTQPYRLLHIRLERPRTGPGGPGDLAWVWPLAVMVMLPLLFIRRKCQK